jgi:hypothetical protein
MEEKPVPLQLHPVYFNENGFDQTLQGTYYLVARNGIFLHKQNVLGTGLIQVDGIPWLQEAANHIKLSLPKIPASIIGMSVHFFRLVFERYRSEACLLLMFSQEASEFRLWCPTQTVSSRGIDYDRADFSVRRHQEWGHEVNHQQWVMIGSLHSHGELPAFHSLDDRKDNATFDGIHVAVGHLDSSQFSMAAAVVMNGFHVSVRPDEFFLGVKQIGPVADEAWPEAATDTAFVRVRLSEQEERLVQDSARQIELVWLPKVKLLS